MDRFNTLPDQIIIFICYYLNQRDIYLILSYLSRKWKNIILKPIKLNSDGTKQYLYMSPTFVLGAKLRKHLLTLKSDNDKLNGFLLHFDFRNLKLISCTDIELKKFPSSLPNNLIYLNCGKNELTNLPELPPNLRFLYCHENLLRYLPKLPKYLTLLDCYGNQLTTLPELPSSLKEVWCYDNKLTVLPLIPPRVECLSCCFNQLVELPQLPENLLRLDCRANPLDSLPKLPSSLESLYSENTNLEKKYQVWIDDKSKIQSLFNDLTPSAATN